MPLYQSNSSSRRRAQDVLPLPRNFISISELLDDSQAQGKEVSLIGVVKDCKLPIPTKGGDHKSSLTLYDLSTQGDAEGIELNIFRPSHEMPIVEAGDVVVAYRVKRQNRGGNPSLLTSYRTNMHIYEARQIPRPGSSQSVAAALRSPRRDVSLKLGEKENEYVVWLYDTIDKQHIPDREEFAARAELSMNVRDRFSLLANVQDHKFVDLIVQVVRKPYDEGDRVSMWVSDWTENASFFHKTDDSPGCTDGTPVRDGDPYGYISKSKKTADNGEVEGKWHGPLGKRSLQLTCWEPHADYIRDQVDVGDWVHLRKVQIAYGHNSANLEGFLRGEQGHSNFSDQIKVQILDPQGVASDKVDPRLRDAIRRKRDYENEKKKKNGQPKSVPKRKAEESSQKENAKTKRAKKRAEKQRTFEEVEAKETREQSIPDLNDLVKCENPDTKPRPLSSILEPVTYPTTLANESVSLELPFNCSKDRTHARVVDFHPSKLEDFAVSRRRTDNDCLSDNSADDIDPDSDSDDQGSGARHSSRNRVWEWRFALKLEEARPPALVAKKDRRPATVWVLVGNPQAQLLTGMDAQDLRAAPHGEEALGRLREQMFKLWGDLEERKVDVEARKWEARERVQRGMPPPSSGAGGEEVDGAAGNSPGLEQVSNKPFACCIQQYGVKVEVQEGEEDDAGEGKRWQRVFGLFGTKIASD
ncbi:hypothetical protein KVR01_010791 [Diaporthe batatas]|uniref:uncharacterized protein n=1 Tax=Diaporthe batatas TaxID=748121 RepID=UPI001D05B23C|nr:uncharacterized protein KVR01_010791 [Diaporthe batatas]KAG8159130.1 hypothetical protein KVR01_010791 [Diaporthe batatas]